jgi:hypothetical protein
VDDTQAGGVGGCPGCQGRFRIPVPPRLAQAPRSVAVATVGGADAVAEVLPVDDPNEFIEEVLPGDPRPRRRRRRRRYSGSGGGFSFDLTEILGMDAFLIALTVIASLGLLLFGASFLFRGAAVMLFWFGIVINAVSGLWFLACVFGEDVRAGVLCLLLPFYALIYLLMNFDVVARPFFLNLVGLGMMLFGLVVYASLYY